MRNINEIVTDEDIARVWQHANFGTVSKRDVILEALKDFAQGFSTGNTAKCIVSELGLTRINNGRISLSEAGLEYLLSAHQPTPTHGRTAEEILKDYPLHAAGGIQSTHECIKAMHDFRNQPQPDNYIRTQSDTSCANAVSVLNWKDNIAVTGALNQPQQVREDVIQFLNDLQINPYPDDIWLPVSKDELKGIHEMLQTYFDMPIDRLTGHIGRLLRAPISERAKELLNSQPLPNTVNEELAVTFILDIQDYLYSYMHNNKIEALRKKHLTDAAKYVYNRIEKSFSHPVKEANTVPQEGREEVECTHPYKECVMSGRVNKYGTPLTKCSVCGNDNICDEELMDESVNTFTKEDILAAFCAAEEYVDFNRWFENYKTK